MRHDALGGDAHLPRVRVTGGRRSQRHPFGIGVGMTISGAFEPSSIVTRFRPAVRQICSPMSRLPVKVDLAHARIRAKRIANNAAGAGETLERLRWRAGFKENLYQLQSGERRVRGRLQNDGVAGGQRRADLVADQMQGKVEGADADDDAAGHPHGETELARNARRAVQGYHLPTQTLGLLRGERDDLDRARRLNAALSDDLALLQSDGAGQISVLSTIRSAALRKIS